MAVTAQEQASRESSPSVQPTRSARGPRQRPPVWPSAATLRQSAPIIRLLAELWAIPEIRRVAMFRDGPNIQIAVLLEADDRAAESKISAVERAYMNDTAPHDLVVDVLTPPDWRDSSFSAYATVLDR